MWLSETFCGVRFHFAGVPPALTALRIRLRQRDLLISVLKLFRNFGTLFFTDVLELFDLAGPVAWRSRAAKKKPRPGGAALSQGGGLPPKGGYARPHWSLVRLHTQVKSI
jgi:hypothetical protein